MPAIAPEDPGKCISVEASSRRLYGNGGRASDSVSAVTAASELRCLSQRGDTL